MARKDVSPEYKADYLAVEALARAGLLPIRTAMAVVSALTVLKVAPDSTPADKEMGRMLVELALMNHGVTLPPRASVVEAPSVFPHPGAETPEHRAENVAANNAFAEGYARGSSDLH